MKMAKFITHPFLSSKKHEDPWKNMKFNNYEAELTPSDGTFNVLKEFSLNDVQNVKKVTLRATALGIFDLFLNSQRVGNITDSDTVYDEYKPGWTDYRYRVFEYEYNVTSMCQEQNSLVAVVTPGWWSGRISFGFYGFKDLAFAAEIEISYDNGETQIISSDESWKTAVLGPVMFADIWDGEYYDATAPSPITSPNAHEWIDASIFDDYTCEIVPKVGPSIRVRNDLTRRPISAVCHNGVIDNQSKLGAINVISKRTGENCEKTLLNTGNALILDMGQNMTGRPRLTLKASRGTIVKAYFAEMLNDSGDPDRGNDGPMGSMYLKNYRSAKSRIVYVASGDGVETYFPTHAFFGFRYVEIRADRDIELISVEGEVICSEFTETGSFICDNDEVNQLYSNTVWGMRSNYLSVPTDCPQRDERLGWTGDTQIFSGAASYLADIRPFMHKWLGDAYDSQKGFNGAYGDVIPRVFNRTDGNAAWGDAGIIVPYKLYQMYNDKEILEEHFDSMEYYLKFLEQYGLEGPNTAYGDWLNYEKTDKRYIAVSYYAYDASLMSKISHIIERPDRSQYYENLHQKIKSFWQKRYVQSNELTESSQTGYLLALAFDLVPSELKEKFSNNLKKKITDNDYTLSSGFVGTGILNQTLGSLGHYDLCYSLLLQTKDPSWLYSVKQGATTVWERWNSYTIEKGFGNVSMNSFNHYAYGAVVEWFYSGMCGIKPDPDAPGFKHFILEPTPDMRTKSELTAGQKHINMASAKFNSVSGVISSSWQRTDNSFKYRFNIPKDTEATVSLVSASDSIRINDLTFTIQELSGHRSADRLVFSLSCGNYEIITDQ